MSARFGRSLVLVAVIASVGACESINSAAHSLDQAQRDAHSRAQETKPLKELGTEANSAAGTCDRLRFQDIAYDEERTIGEAAAIQLAADNGGILVDKSGANAPTVALNQLGRRLAAVSERPNLTWTFAILDSEEINAFSTPGGIVFVTKGLLKNVQNEAQLAGVLAHEIAHVTGRHVLNKYRVVKVDQCNKCTTACAVGKAMTKAASLEVTQRMSKMMGSESGHVEFKGAEDVLANMGGEVSKSLQHDKFDPKQETQADYDAVGLLVSAGYAPEEYAKFLESLPDSFQHETHPPKKDRVADVHSIINTYAKDELRGAGAPFGPEQGFAAGPVSPELASIK